MTGQELRQQTISFRMGYVEGQSGERDCYLLQTGACNADEYERGFQQGLADMEANQ